MTAAPTRPIKLYRFALSGHAHRAELFLSLLRLPFESIDVDLTKGEHKRPEFLAMNPFGQVPVIDDGGNIVADSNAILTYLALCYGDASWLPRDPLGAPLACSAGSRSPPVRSPTVRHAPACWCCSAGPTIRPSASPLRMRCSS